MLLIAVTLRCFMDAGRARCPWDSYVCYYAAGNGHLEVLRWARSQAVLGMKMCPLLQPGVVTSRSWSG